MQHISHRRKNLESFNNTEIVKCNNYLTQLVGLLNFEEGAHPLVRVAFSSL